MPRSADRRHERSLIGTLVASPFVGKDENDVEGTFFPFPDLSCRTAGTYVLKFSLIILDLSNMKHSKVPIRHSITSNAFCVYNPKDFTGMRTSTELTKSLRAQGCLISVKKGNIKTIALNASDERGLEDEMHSADVSSGKVPEQR